MPLIEILKILIKFPFNSVSSAFCDDFMGLLVKYFRYKIRENIGKLQTRQRTCLKTLSSTSRRCFKNEKVSLKFIIDMNDFSPHELSHE